MSEARLGRPTLDSALAIALVIGCIGWLSIAGCGDDPSSPTLPFSLAGADSASVQLHILCATQTRDIIGLNWRDFTVGLSGGSYHADSTVFYGDQVVSSEFSSTQDLIRLKFDPRSGDIDSLTTWRQRSSRGGGMGERILAHDIPLISHEVVDGRLEALWRLEGVMTCAALDTLVHNSGPPGTQLLTWSCAGDDVAFLEIRVTNSIPPE